MTGRTLLTCIFMLSAVAVCGQRWQIAPDGRGIVWKVGSDIPHDDHIEMSGERMAFVLRWGVDSRGAFRQERSLVFPLLRTLPNNTHASLMYRMAADIPSLLGVDGLALQDERVGQVAIDGALEVRSRWGVGKMNVGSARDMKPEPVVEMTRTIFPSRTLPLMCERYTLRNVGAKPLTVSVPEFSQVVTTDPAKGVTGSYVVRGDIAGSGTFTLAAGDSLAFDAVFQAYPGGGEPLHPDVAAELAARMAFVRECIDANLVLETPDPVIDTQFRYAKLRAAESIVATKGGYMHAPGGESYYAAIWANDQAEYVNPFFPFLGYGVGNASALNSFRHFARFMNPAYEPLPSSVIAEGDDIWNGAGDRGDAAMIACGRHATPLRAVTVPRPPSCGRSSSGASNTAAASLRPTASWLPTPTNWRGVSPPAMPTSAPRRSITMHCCRPCRSAASWAWNPPRPPAMPHRPGRSPELSTRTSAARSAGTTPTATMRAIRCCARGSACR